MTPPLYFSSADELETSFYRNFNHGNAEGLMQLWSVEDEIVCIHPTGIRLVGMNAIQAGWTNIFFNEQLHVKHRRAALWKSTVFAVHQLEETLFIADDATPQGILYATHVYALGARGWRIVSRHASPVDQSLQAVADGIPKILH